MGQDFPTGPPASPRETPPPAVLNNKYTQTMSWCRLYPVACVREVSIEAAFLAAAYIFMLFVTGSELPTVWRVLKFGLIFMLLTIAGRMISDGLGDKMAITAVSGLGGKMVSIMAKGFVSW